MKMNKIIIAAAAMAAFSGQVNAQATTPGAIITSAGCDGNNNCFINLDRNVVTGALPACPNSIQIRWDATTPVGRNFTATALTARAAGLPVNVGTTGACAGGPTDDVFSVLNFISIVN